jgi:hypothetical protein
MALSAATVHCWRWSGPGTVRPRILLTGLGGVGKTTLARGFLEWLATTNGLGEGCLWFKFNEIRSAEYVLDEMGEKMLNDSQFRTKGLDSKLEDLAARLKEHRHVIVWDNFESARGIPGTAVTANLSEEDCGLVARFLSKLRGGASKVLLTSRSEEDWLGSKRRYRLEIGGLDGEERWEYCEVLLRDLGLRVNRGDKDLAELMRALKGHPRRSWPVLPEAPCASPFIELSWWGPPDASFPGQ